MALARPPSAPPGPAGYPLMGVFPIARRDPLDFFLGCARRYGDVVSMRLGVHRAYLVSHPDHVKRVLQDNARAYAKGPPAARVHALFGDSLTVVDGDRWRQRRRQVHPAFQAGQHASFATIVARASAELLDRWRPLGERGEPVDVVSEMRRLTQTIIIRAVFGEVRPAEIQALGEALDLAVAHVDQRLWSALGWLEVPTPAGAKYRRALRVVNAFVAQRVSAARRDGSSPGPLLAALLDPLSDAELHDELKALLVAGHTTTASALAWTWYRLSEHPEARGRIEEESRDVLAGRAPGLDDLARLGYTRRVIEEVLRLHPPTWLTARTPVEDDELGGYRIPAGSLVLLSPYVTHRHPAVWEAPERFDPDRFGPEASAARPAFAYFPFGGGPRRCIGSALATAEVQCIVATIAQHHRLDLLPGARVTPAAALTLHPRSAVPILLRPAAPTRKAESTRS
ncbi:MAG TPA: cytochrome P450 [Methylomirabilota bacterium]|nr:cytochrome P450 [Methylomirabilota bacterium]